MENISRSCESHFTVEAKGAFDVWQTWSHEATEGSMRLFLKTKRTVSSLTLLHPKLSLQLLILSADPVFLLSSRWQINRQNKTSAHPWGSADHVMVSFVLSEDSHSEQGADRKQVSQKTFHNMFKRHKTWYQDMKMIQLSSIFLVNVLFSIVVHSNNFWFYFICSNLNLVMYFHLLIVRCNKQPPSHQ